MELDELTVEITEDNIDAIQEQMISENEVASLDCLALNPDIADQVNGDGYRSGQYEIHIYKIDVGDKEAFLLYFDDGEWNTLEEFVERSHFYETEAAALAGMGAGYNDWLTRF
jgi:hypothetical protein